MKNATDDILRLTAFEFLKAGILSTATVSLALWLSIFMIEYLTEMSSIPLSAF